MKDIKKCRYSVVTYNLMGHITMKLMHVENLPDQYGCGPVEKGKERAVEDDEIRKVFQKEMVI